MRILVTNDDGVDSIGIQVLAAALAETEHDVVVVAPSKDQSGTSSSLGVFDPRMGLEATKVELPEAPGVEAWALGAPPAMCTLSAVLGGFGDKPDLVVSGINAGLNTGRSVLHSGTVGATLTAQNLGLSGLAVSVQASETWRWDTAAALAVQALPMVIESPARSVLNLNVPALDLSEVKGLRWSRLATFGEVRAGVVGIDEQDGTRRLKMDLLMSDRDIEDDTDQGLVRQGWAAITALVGVVEAWPADTSLAGADPDVLDDVATTIVPGADHHVAHRLPDVVNGAVLRRFVVDDPDAESNFEATF